VNFCGKTYKVKQVLIDGVDVVQRVAELATKNLLSETLEQKASEDKWKTVENNKHEAEKAICENIQMNTVDDLIKVTIAGPAGTDFSAGNGLKVYPIVLNVSFFSFDTNGKIYTAGGYGDGTVEIIGKFR